MSPYVDEDGYCIHDMEIAFCFGCMEAKRNEERSEREKGRGIRRCRKCTAPIGGPTTRFLCDSCEWRIAEAQAHAEPAASGEDDDYTEPWRLRYALRPWQEEAISAWEGYGHRGVIEAATGTGKTALALAAIDRLHAAHPGALRTAIVVPTLALAGQWRHEVATQLGVGLGRIGEIHSGAVNPYRDNHEVLIIALPSAAKKLPDKLKSWKSQRYKAFVVVDECHRAGAEHHSKLFDGPYEFAMGLSATPERDDDGHRQHVYPALGTPVYQYPLLQALDDGVLSPVTSINLYVDFTSAEQARWDGLGEDIAKAIRTIEADPPGIGRLSGPKLFAAMSELAEAGSAAAGRFLRLVSDRRQLLSTAENRLACQDAVLRWIHEGEQRSLVFHETIDTAQRSADFLSELGTKVALEHSELAQSDRKRSLNRLRVGGAQVLVAVRSLDEGIDVPEASVALIAAGSRSRRQRIQRIGRIVRRQDGKHAVVITILVRGTPEEAGVGRRDDDLLGTRRVRHHQWPAGAIGIDLQTRRSSYRPPQGKSSAADEVTVYDLAENGTPSKPRRQNARPIDPSAYFEPDGAAHLAVNAWHNAEEVRAALGIPSDPFDEIRRRVRKAYRRRLDGQQNESRLVHGSEIEAIVREYTAHVRRF